MALLADGRVLLYGGRGANGVLGDTWVFTATAARDASGVTHARTSGDWNQLTPPGSPGPRSGHLLVTLAGQSIA